MLGSIPLRLILFLFYYLSPPSAGETRLLRAAVMGDVPLVKELISKGADVDMADHAGCSPLHAAADTEVARLLLAVSQRRAKRRRATSWKESRI